MEDKPADLPGVPATAVSRPTCGNGEVLTNMAHQRGIVRIAALADLHFGRMAEPLLHQTLIQASHECEEMVLCGDLTDHGLPEEAHGLARELRQTVGVPVIAVLGNHDFEAGRPAEVCEILAESGVTMLDGQSCEVAGVGFAGVKGFAGGFGKRALGPWGEDIIKQFVHEAVGEALKLESALARLRRKPRIAVLHYSPIQATVEGEPREIFPFLGSSRLEEPLARYPVDAVFHGHAHRGQPEGRTAAGVPVYNVSFSLLHQAFPGRPPFRVIEVAARSAGDGGSLEGAPGRGVAAGSEPADPGDGSHRRDIDGAAGFKATGAASRPS
jgi:Icc-related predicted phosphoesterase